MPSRIQTQQQQHQQQKTTQQKSQQLLQRNLGKSQSLSQSLQQIFQPTSSAISTKSSLLRNSVHNLMLENRVINTPTTDFSSSSEYGGGSGAGGRGGGCNYGANGSNLSSSTSQKRRRNSAFCMPSVQKSIYSDDSLMNQKTPSIITSSTIPRTLSSIPLKNDNGQSCTIRKKTTKYKGCPLSSQRHKIYYIRSNSFDDHIKTKYDQDMNTIPPLISHRQSHHHCPISFSIPQMIKENKKLMKSSTDSYINQLLRTSIDSSYKNLYNKKLQSLSHCSLALPSDDQRDIDFHHQRHNRFIKNSQELRKMTNSPKSNYYRRKPIKSKPKRTHSKIEQYSSEVQQNIPKGIPSSVIQRLRQVSASLDDLLLRKKSTHRQGRERASTISKLKDNELHQGNLRIPLAAASIKKQLERHHHLHKQSPLQNRSIDFSNYFTYHGNSSSKSPVSNLLRRRRNYRPYDSDIDDYYKTDNEIYRLSRLHDLTAGEISDVSSLTSSQSSSSLSASSSAAAPSSSIMSTRSIAASNVKRNIYQRSSRSASTDSLESNDDIPHSFQTKKFLTNQAILTSSSIDGTISGSSTSNLMPSLASLVPYTNFYSQPQQHQQSQQLLLPPVPFQQHQQQQQKHIIQYNDIFHSSIPPPLKTYYHQATPFHYFPNNANNINRAIGPQHLSTMLYKTALLTTATTTVCGSTMLSTTTTTISTPTPTDGITSINLLNSFSPAANNWNSPSVRPSS